MYQPIKDEKRPYGKDSIVISQDNIEYARMRRQAAQRLQRGQATMEDRALLTDAERMIQNVTDQKYKEEEL